MARNATLNCLKKQAHEWKARTTWERQRRPYVEASGHAALEAEYNNILLQAIRQLPRQQQKVYELARNEGRSYEDIAAQLSISTLTVKTHMSRALASIRGAADCHRREYPMYGHSLGW